MCGENAFIPGELNPSLAPGSYTMKTSINNGRLKATVFKWKITNPGANKELVGSASETSHATDESRPSGKSRSHAPEYQDAVIDLAPRNPKSFQYPTRDAVLQVANEVLAFVNERENEIVRLTSPIFTYQALIGAYGFRATEAYSCTLWAAGLGPRIVATYNALKAAGYSDAALERIYDGPTSHADLRAIVARLNVIATRLPK